MIFPYFSALAPGMGALLVIVSGKSQVLAALLTNRLAVGLGLISYSLYLIHWPVLVFYKLYKYQPLESTESVVLLLVSLLLAGLMYRWVEQPFRKTTFTANSKGAHTKFLITSVSMMLTIALIGLFIGQSDGKTWRNKHALTAQQIEIGRQQRYELIRQGCTVLRLDEARYCGSNSAHQILVIGNSHEPDGYNIFHQIYGTNEQINLISFGTLNGCRVSMKRGVPASAIKLHECEARTAVLSDETFLRNLDGVILSSNQPFDEKQTSDWEILHYLRKENPALPIVVLGAYLNTERNCTDLHQRFGSFGACKQLRHLSYNPFNEYQNSELALSKSIDYLYLDKTRLVCKKGTLSSCAIRAGSEPAFYDRHHLSRSFARHLGRRITEEYAEDLMGEGFPMIVPAKATQSN